MGWGDWIDLSSLKAMSHHLSAVVGAMIVFVLVGALVEYFVPEGTLKTILRVIEGFILVGLMLVFAWRLFKVLLSGMRKGNGAHYGLLAA